MAWKNGIIRIDGWHRWHSIAFALIWTLWLAPLDWCDLLADEPGGSIPLWKQGISTWNGNSYTPPTTDATTPFSSDAVLEDPAPYTVPVDPKLYTEPLANVPYVLNDGIPAQPAGNAVPALSHSAPTQLTPPLSDPAPPSASRPTGSNGNGGSTPSLELGDDNEAAILPAPKIGQQIQEGLQINEPPLQQETLRWYQHPWRWMTTGWKNHAEFGLDGSQGNAETLALQAGVELKRKTDIYTLAFDFDYRFVNNRNTTTEDNGRFNIDYDRLVAESPWSIFGKYGLEWDKFKAFDLRINLNAGVGYHWIRNERTTFVSRFGAGASREINAPIDRWTPEAVFSLDGEHQLNSRNKLKGKVNYFPAWEDFADYRLVTDLGWEILLDDAENLSLKLAVTDRYDSTPQGAEPNDVYYSALLLVKF